VKKAILKAYELVPSCKKWDDQTQAEFAREQEHLFDKWLTTKIVTKNIDKLRQIICIEEFEQCVHSDIKTYLDEH
jgi:hypothetical protein